MKVLFLTRYPVEGASSRYRVFQYVPYLEALGIDCTVSPFMGPRLYRLMSRRGRTAQKTLLTALATLRRLSWLLRSGRFDVVVFQREALPFNTTIVERWLSRRHGTVFDYDDALFIGKVNRATPLAAALRNETKTFRIFEVVDLVLAGNDWLASVARERGARAEAFHVAEDVGRFEGVRSKDAVGRAVTLGWLGSSTTEKYLELIRGPLERIAVSHGARLHVVGGGAFRSDVLDVAHSPWTLDSEPERLASFDVGLMPLPLEEWSKGKSGGKARTYMAAGVPPLVTGIGYNLELIEHGRTGMMVKTEDEWYDALVHLCEDPALRASIAAAAREEVRSRFCPEKQARQLADWLREVAA